MVDEYLPAPHQADAPATRSAEDAPYINELQPSLPDGSDNIGKGDDHIRVIKSATLGTFRNFIDSNLLGIQEYIRYSTDDLNNLRNQINGIAGKTYYVPQKTAYDAAPAGTYEKSYVFSISNIETPLASGRRIISSKLSMPALGEIFATVLTEKKINEVYGVIYTGSTPNGPLIFKVCDGSNIATSRYGILFSVTTLPNLKTSGAFLASLDDEAKNVSIPSKSYPKDTTYRGTFDPTLLNGLLQNDSGHNHSVSDYMYTSRAVATNGQTHKWGEGFGGINNRDTPANTVTGKHKHTITPPATATMTFPVTYTETRPKSVEINYLMRIN
jgi:hypothetical protein